MSVHDCPRCDCDEFTPSLTAEEIAEAKERQRLEDEERRSMRWCPARSAVEQVAKELNSVLLHGAEWWLRPGFQQIMVFGKRVGVDVSAEEALEMLATARARASA